VNDKTRKQKRNSAQPADVSHEEMEELKRDMHTARLMAWAYENQRTLIAAGIAVLVLITGVSLWNERIQSQHSAAAVLYHQALGTAEQERKISLLKTVIHDYDSTSYSTLALMLLSRLDAGQTGQYLKALLSRSDLTPEIKWQARLDLASFRLKQGDAGAVRTLLAQPVEKDYEQLRFYLLGRAADSAARKREYLIKALAAVSHDSELKKSIERSLSELDGAAKSGQ